MTGFPSPDEATAILLAAILVVLIVIAIEVRRRSPSKAEDETNLTLREMHWKIASVREVLINAPLGALVDSLREQRLTNELLLIVAGYTERIPEPQPDTTDEAPRYQDAEAHRARDAEAQYAVTAREEENEAHDALVAANEKMLSAIEIATRPLPPTYTGEHRVGAEAIQSILRTALTKK